jgi:uncharacterized oxidoreductase
MNVTGNNILITGGGTGIGLALAERFLKAGSQVTICGRREAALREAQSKNPLLDIRVCDVSSPDERIKLMEWAKAQRPGFNVLVNNAGIQRRGVNLVETEDWDAIHQEIAINLEAPIHLARLFAEHLSKQSDPAAANPANATPAIVTPASVSPAIINVTSGLAFVPLAMVPVYCATKAALHSFTLSLRHHLAKTPIKVIEIIPPAVNTDLGGPGLHNFGVPLDEFSDAIFSRLQGDELEIAYGFAQKSSRASRQELDGLFEQMNQPH